MAILNDEVKTEIVKALASFCGYEESALLIRERFGIAIDRFQIRTYDPTSFSFSAGEKWRSVFDAAREQFLQQVAAVPISHAAYRLGQLQRLLDKAKRTGNFKLALWALRQAAVEAGSVEKQWATALAQRMPTSFKG